MIVVCTTCHARFKVADDKIGPRGAKVRCSKCQTVFLVHRDLGVMSAEPQQAAPPAPAPARRGMELDLESEPMGGVRPSGFIADPFARSPAAPAPDPFGVPPATHPSAPDPFSAAPQPAQPQRPQAADPFGGIGGGSFGAVDPFVATVASSAPGLPTSAVTDLSDLIGSPAGTPVPAAATPPPEPSGILDTGFDFDPSAAQPELEIAPTPLPAATQPGAAPEPDLALAERTPMPVPVQRSSAPFPGMGDFAGADGFDAQGGLEMDGGPGFGGAEDEAFGGGHELHAPPATSAAPPPPAPAPEAPPSPPVAPPAVAPADAGPEEAAAEGLRQRSSGVRALLVNAISLVAVVAVAVGLLAFWRGMRPGAAGLHPRSLFGALSVQPQPFGTSQLRSGLFERSDAAPILFVAGKAVSHAATAVRGLHVRVELVSKGAVVARGEARAGAVPSPEELYVARDGAALATVFERLAAQAPAAVKPGDAVPFLVAISDFPADITGIALKVSVEPVEMAAEGKGALKP